MHKPMATPDPAPNPDAKTKAAAGAIPDEHLEHELREALRRVPAPAGFADRLMLRAAALARPAARPRRRLLAIAATLLVALSLADGAYRGEQRRQQREARAAAQEFSLAMRLTGAALARAGDRLHSHALLDRRVVD